MERPELERQRIHELAKEYEAKGYDVLIQPNSDQLPEFLSQYRPDILVKGQDEAVVIEVKSRASLRNAIYLRDLAREIEQHPGWRLELAVTNPSEEEGYIEEADPLGREDIVKNLKESDELVESNHQEAALLVAWSTAEAVLRLLADREQIRLKRNDPLYLLKELATYAVVSRDEYNLLMRALNLRNAVAHGFKTTELDSDFIRQLTRTINRLLESVPEASVA